MDLIERLNSLGSFELGIQEWVVEVDESDGGFVACWAFIGQKHVGGQPQWSTGIHTADTADGALNAALEARFRSTD